MVMEAGLAFLGMNRLERDQIEIGDRRIISPYCCFQMGDHCILVRKDNGFTCFLNREEERSIHNGKVSLANLVGMKADGLLKGSFDFHNECSDFAPSFFLIDITGNCNFNCVYCFRRKIKEKTIDEAHLIRICEYIIHHCQRFHINRITIQPWGGEPLLEVEKVLYIRRYFNENSDIDVNIIVETNGSKVTQKIADILIENRIGLSFSFDGLPEIHRAHRRDSSGLDTTDRVKVGIKNALKAGYRNLNAICVLSRLSLGKISEIADYASEELGLSGIRLNPLHIPYQGIADELRCSEEEWKQLFNEIAALGINLYRKGSSFREANTWERIDNIIGHSRTSICRSQGCCGGKKIVSFSMEGNIYPCELIDWPEYCLGNIDDPKDLCTLVKESVVSNRYFTPKWKSECASCPWWSFCRGGCTADQIYCGRLGKGVDEQECLFNWVMYDQIIRFLLTQAPIMERLETEHHRICT